MAGGGGQQMMGGGGPMYRGGGPMGTDFERGGMPSMGAPQFPGSGMREYTRSLQNWNPMMNQQTGGEANRAIMPVPMQGMGGGPVATGFVGKYGDGSGNMFLSGSMPPGMGGYDRQYIPDMGGGPTRPQPGPMQGRMGMYGTQGGYAPQPAWSKAPKLG